MPQPNPEYIRELVEIVNIDDNARQGAENEIA
jgi:hypothetical protein